jgi:hypothetical protein
MNIVAFTLPFCFVTACAVPERASAQANSIEIPAFTAYSEPDPDSIAIRRDGASGWNDMGQKLVWFGYIKNPGKLVPEVHLTLPAGESVTLRLTVGDQHSDVTVTGGAEAKATFRQADFMAAGYYSFTLEGVRKSGASFGVIQALSLQGDAAADAHFNMKERRNAASVHLMYPLPENTNATWFYNEVTPERDPLWTYYMATGFRRGYFGIQVNSPTERRIIFSVWDSGNEGVDRSKVAADDRVQLLAKGEGVVASDFGNEGTGGHSHMVYPWKTGQTYRFLVSAEPDGTHTVYTAYFFFPEKAKWGLIASFRAPKDGDYLRGLYSFNENFGGANGEKQRLAEFGNQWIKTSRGKWIEITTAKFSHDGTGKADRLDYSAGVRDGRFYLSNGGFTANGIKYGDPITRPAVGHPPVLTAEVLGHASPLPQGGAR